MHRSLISGLIALSVLLAGISLYQWWTDITVQDGAVCGHPVDADPCPGPYEAVEDFLAENDGFVTVREHERLMMTSNRWAS